MTWIVVLLLVVYGVRIYLKYVAEQKKQEKRRLENFKPESQVENMMPTFPVLEDYMQTEINSNDIDTTQEVFSYENIDEYSLDEYIEVEAKEKAIQKIEEKEDHRERIKGVDIREDIPYIGRFSPESALIYDAIMHPKHEEV